MNQDRKASGSAIRFVNWRLESFAEREKQCRIWLAEAPGIGSKWWQHLVTCFGSAESVYRASSREWCEAGLPVRLLENLEAHRHQSSAKQRYQELHQKEVNTVVLGEQAYPEGLAQIHLPPPVLYYRGRIDSFSRLVAIVGTRKPTDYGLRVTRILVQQLATGGVGVVSGLAFGIDAQAHRETVAMGGKTLAVLGSGVLRVTPAAHTRLAEEIEKEGAVTSTFLPEEGAKPGFFAARNRIIAGLAEAVVVIEGSAQSGALITAREAIKQAKPVYAVPGPITSTMSQAPYMLLREGARLLTNPEELLPALQIKVSSRFETRQLKELENGDARQKAIWQKLGAEAMEIETLVIETGLGISELNQVLLEMELGGLVVKQGKWVSRAS